MFRLGCFLCVARDGVMSQLANGRIHNTFKAYGSIVPLEERA